MSGHQHGDLCLAAADVNRGAGDGPPAEPGSEPRGPFRTRVLRLPDRQVRHPSRPGSFLRRGGDDLPGVVPDAGLDRQKRQQGEPRA